MQTWHFASRAECQRCHNKYSGTVLGFNIPQLHQDSTSSQLDHFASIGLLTTLVPNKQRLSLASPNDQSASLDARARAYLHVNCAHCHRMSAGGAVLSYMHFDLPLDKSNMLAAPSQGDFKMQKAKVIAPGDAFRSVLLYRMSKLGGGKMPRLGADEIDRNGIALIEDWISAMTPSEVDHAKQLLEQRVENEAAIKQLQTDSQDDSHARLIQKLLGSTSGALALQRAMSRKTLTPAATALAVQFGTKHAEESVRDLFERFLPPSERVKRLGYSVQPEAILAMVGDAQRGSKLFFETASINCQSCHRITGVGKELGPDLTLIGDKLNTMQMLESIIEKAAMN
jgi:mono/diheme cytochrome c family protein